MSSFTEPYTQIERVPLERVTLTVLSSTPLRDVSESSCGPAGRFGADRRSIVVAKDVLIELSGTSRFPDDMKGTSNDGRALRTVLICVEETEGLSICPETGN